MDKLELKRSSLGSLKDMRGSIRDAKRGGTSSRVSTARSSRTAKRGEPVVVMLEQPRNWLPILKLVSCRVRCMVSCMVRCMMSCMLRCMLRCMERCMEMWCLSLMQHGAC